jgi:hypothetical protein
MNLKTILWLFVLALIVFSLYFPGLKIKYYGDDFEFVFLSPSTKIFYFLSHSNPYNGFYRPIQATFATVIQTYFGLNTLPIHVTQIFLHLLLSWLIFVFMNRMAFSRLQAALGSLFMLVSQTNVYAVLGNDTLSQISGTLFGCCSIWLLVSYYYPHITEGTEDRLRGLIYYKYILSILMFFFSLLSKETSASFFVLLIGIVLVNNLRIKDRISIKRIVIEICPYLIVMALYYTLRLQASKIQPFWGPGRYNFHIGLNIIKNLAMFLFAAFSPISSVTTFTAFMEGKLAVFPIIATLSLVLFFLVVYGLLCSDRRGIIYVLAIFAIITLFPAAAMNHIGELYLYNSIPFISILVGIGLGRLLNLGKANRIRQGLIVVLIGLLLTSHVIATRSKIFLMKNNGERVAPLLKQVMAYVPKVPKNGHLLLLNPDNDEIEYSVFLMKGFNVLGLNRIMQLSGRDDFRIAVVERSDRGRPKYIDPLKAWIIKMSDSGLERAKSKQDCLILTLEDSTVQVY